MLEMSWLDEHHVPDGTLEGAVRLANQLYWALAVVEGTSGYLVYAGDKVILRADSRESVDAFLYGFGLAYGCLPKEVLRVLQERLKSLVE